MVFTIFALLLLGLFLGSVAQIPIPVSLIAGALIVIWLTIFTVRERRSGRSEGDA